MPRWLQAFLEAVFGGVSTGRGEGNGDRDFPRGGNGSGVKYIMRVLLTIRAMLIMLVLAPPRKGRLMWAELSLAGLG